MFICKTYTYIREKFAKIMHLFAESILRFSFIEILFTENKLN